MKTNSNVLTPAKSKTIESAIKAVVSFGLVVYAALTLLSFGKSTSLAGPNGFYILFRIVMDGILSATTYIFEAVLISSLLSLLTSDTVNRLSKQIITYLKLALFYLYPITILVSAFKQLSHKPIPWPQLVQAFQHSSWLVWGQNLVPLVLFLVIVGLFMNVAVSGDNNDSSKSN